MAEPRRTPLSAYAPEEEQGRPAPIAAPRRAGRTPLSALASPDRTRPYGRPEAGEEEAESARSGTNFAESAQRIGSELVKSYGMRYEDGEWSWSVDNIGKAWEESPFWTTVDYLTLGLPVAKWGLAARAVTKEASLAGRAYKAGADFAFTEVGKRGRFAQALGVDERFARATQFQMRHGAAQGRFGAAMSSRVAQDAVNDPEWMNYVAKYGPDNGDVRSVAASFLREAHAEKVVAGREAQRLMKAQGGMDDVAGANFYRAMQLGDTGVVGNSRNAAYRPLQTHSFSQATGVGAVGAAARAEKKLQARRLLIEGKIGKGAQSKKYEIAPEHMQAYHQTFQFRAQVHEGLKDAGLISEEVYQKNLHRYMPRVYEELYGRVGVPGGAKGGANVLGGSRRGLQDTSLSMEQVRKLEGADVMNRILDPRISTAELGKAAMNLSGHNFFANLSNSVAVRDSGQMLRHVNDLLNGPADDLMLQAQRGLYKPEQLEGMRTRLKSYMELDGTTGRMGIKHAGVTTEAVRNLVEEELGWVRLGDVMRGAPSKYLDRLPKAMLDKFVDPAVIEDVRGLAKFAEQSEDLVDVVKKTYQVGLNWFKGSKTILNPATQFRNVFGAMLFHHMTVGGAGFLQHGGFQRGFKALVTEKGGRDAERLLESGLLDTSLAHEIGDVLKKDFDIGAGSSGIGASMNNFLTKLPAIGRTWAGQKAAKGAQTIGDGMEQTYRFVDELAKADAFLVVRERWEQKLKLDAKWVTAGADAIETESRSRAFAEVAKYQPMFSQGSSFTNAMRNVVPFASFTTESARIWKNLLSDKPHIAFFWNHTVEALSEVTGAIAGIGSADMKEARESMPEYQQGKKMLMVPWRVDGKPTFLDMSYMIPMANIGGIDTAKATFFDYAQINPFTANPAIAFASAAHTGDNPFTRKPLEPSFTENQLGIDVNGEQLKKHVGLLEYGIQMALPPMIPPGQAGVNLLELARGTLDRNAAPLEEGVVRTALTNVMGLRLYEADAKSQIGNVIRNQEQTNKRLTERWNRYALAVANGRTDRAQTQLEEIHAIKLGSGKTEEESADYISKGIKLRQPGAYRSLSTAEAKSVLERSRRLNYTDARDAKVVAALQHLVSERTASKAKSRKKPRYRARERR